MKNADNAELLEALSAAAPSPSILTNTDQSVLLTRAFFPATQDLVVPGVHLKMAMCTSGGGTLRYRSASRNVNFRWRQGGIFFTLPHEQAEFDSPDVGILGLAVNLDGFSSRLTPDRLQDAIASRSGDRVIQSVLKTLWTAAELHGGASAFIDAGVNLILERLDSQDSRHLGERVEAKLSRRQMGTIRDYLESRLPGDLRVGELADLVGMDEGRFCRSIKATTGYAPYAYITACRMERAKSLLATGSSVTDTAIVVGYANPSKFAAAFKRIVGCTPSDWRRRS